MEGILLGDKYIFCLYLAFHWRDVTETKYLALYTHTLQTMHVCLMTVNKEGLFTWTKVLFLLYLAFHWSVITEIPHLALYAQALQAVQAWI
jgi:hypothetical protein